MLEPADPGVQLFVARVGVGVRSHRARVPGEQLGEEEVLRGRVDVRDGGVAERVEVVVDLEAGLALPTNERSPGRVVGRAGACSTERGEP